MISLFKVIPSPSPSKTQYTNLKRAKHKLDYSLNDKHLTEKPKIEAIEATIERLKDNPKHKKIQKKISEPKQKDHEVQKLKEYYLSKIQ